MEKSLLDLVGEYVNAAEAHGTATEQSLPEESVCAVAAIVYSVRRILASTNGDRGVFKTLLAHSNPFVRLWAATHVFATDQPVAIHALEQILCCESGYAVANAAATLNEIRLGRFKPTE